jgi:GR25 family glycosyltransferase involved in LPS biosynthesis
MKRRQSGGEMDKSTNYWNYFDKIYCISLDERSDRREEAKKQFNKIGLLAYVEFFIVNKHPHDSEEGIFESHIACIKKGLAAGAGKIVIFEDDIVFDGFTPESLKQCVDFMKKIPDWKAFFFGCLVSRSIKTHSKGVIKIKYRSLAHAYVLNRGFAELLVKKTWRKIAFDTEMKSYKNGFYAAFPSFAFQDNSTTDNSKCLGLDKFRRICGGLQRIQKRNELFHSYRSIFIALHILFILLTVFQF